MSVVTIWYPDLSTEAEVEQKLEKIRKEMRDFRSRSHPETRTRELWDRWYQLQANEAWLEERLEYLKKHRGIVRKPERKTVRKRRSDDDE